jgi:hypothetical protein
MRAGGRKRSVVELQTQDTHLVFSMFFLLFFTRDVYFLTTCFMAAYCRICCAAVVVPCGT